MMTNFYKVQLLNKYKYLLFTFFILISNLGYTNPGDTIYNTIKTESVAEKYPNLNYDDYTEYLNKQENKKKQNKNKTDKPKNNNDIDVNKIQQIFKVIGWILLTVIVISVAYFIIKNKGFNFFNKSSKKIINDEDIEKHINEVDIDTLLKNAINNNQQELIIRFYFLKFLKTLAHKNYIKWHADKTNSDYLYEIKNADLKKDFDYASYLYTYIWYGKFDITPELFSKAQNHFKTIIDRY